MGSAWDWNEDDIRYLYLECGWTAKAIAEEWGIPYVSMNRQIRKMGIGRGQGNYERGPVIDDPVLVANVAARYVDAGMTVIEIADELCLGRKKVANVLARAGVVRRKAAGRDQHGPKNNNWRGGPGIRPCDQLYRTEVVREGFPGEQRLVPIEQGGLDGTGDQR